jgi:hypothetical protein
MELKNRKKKKKRVCGVGLGRWRERKGGNRGYCEMEEWRSEQLIVSSGWKVVKVKKEVGQKILWGGFSISEKSSQYKNL